MQLPHPAGVRPRPASLICSPGGKAPVRAGFSHGNHPISMAATVHPQTRGSRTPGWGAEWRETLRLSGPLALANLLQMLTYAIDVIFIARIGPDELAAAALVMAIFSLLVLSLSGLTGAVAPIAAAEIGARGPALRPVRRAVRMALWQAVLMGGLAMIPCAFASSILRLAGQEPHIAALADQYMGILLFALVPMVASSVLRNFVSTLGRPVFATMITALGIGVNALANYALVFGRLGFPELGLRGAAIATVLTALVVFGAYCAAIRADPRLHRYHVFGFFWRPDWRRFADLFRIGTPIAFTILAEAGIFSAAAFLMGLIGPAQLAAHAVALQIASLAFQVPFGVAQAVTIRVGYHTGARDRLGVHRAGWAGIAIGAGFMVFTGAAMLIVPEALLSLYLDAGEPGNDVLIAYGSAFLLVAAAFQLSDGVQVVAAGALRGLKDTRVPMWIAIFSYWVPGFGLAAGLGLLTGLEGTGVWIGLAAGLTCAALLMLNRWRRREAIGLLWPA